MGNVQKISYSLWITLIVFLLFIFLFIIFTYTYFGTTIINDFCAYKAATAVNFTCPSYCIDILGPNACSLPSILNNQLNNLLNTTNYIPEIDIINNLDVLNDLD